MNDRDDICGACGYRYGDHAAEEANCPAAVPNTEKTFRKHSTFRQRVPMIRNRFDIILDKPGRVPDKTPEIRYVGWIRRSPVPGARDALMSLGVRGEILYNYKTGVFERCEIDEAVAKNLQEKGVEFFAPAFTAVDGDDKVLPRDKQIFWKGF